MKTRTKIKAGTLSTNHNEKLVVKKTAVKRLGVKSGVKAGVGPTGPQFGLTSVNHNEKIVRR